MHRHRATCCAPFQCGPAAVREQREHPESTDWIRALLESAPNGIVVADREGTIVLVNACAEAMFGYGRDELIGRPVELLVSERLRAAHAAHRARYVADPVTRPLGAGRDLLGRRKDGSEFPVEIGLSSVATRDRLLVTAVISDITARRNAELERQRYADRLEALRELDRAILGAESLEELIRAALSRTRKLEGCARASLTRLDPVTGELVELAVDSEGETALAAGTRLPPGAFSRLEEFRRGDVYVIEDLARVADAPPAARLLSAEGVRSYLVAPMTAAGQMMGTLNLGWEAAGARDEPESVEMARDVANLLAVALVQHELRERLARHAAELERRVAERTAELEERNADLASFAHVVSHDLRAPLLTISGLSEVLLAERGDALGAEGADYARRIVQAAEQLDGLVEDLLAFSEVGRELELEPVPLEAAVAEALAAHEHELGQTGTEVTVASPLPSVVGHRLALVHAVGNLVSNAAKFSAPAATPRVRIVAEERRDRVRLWVEDNGIGIAPEDHERVFRVFERLHGQETYPGTGVGLAIVRRAAERMGGRVGVESDVGRGSRFWLELSKAPGAPAASAAGPAT